MALSPKLARGQTGTGSITSVIDDAIRLDPFAVAGLPAASLHTGKMVYVSNGATGSPCLAYSNGTSWLRVLLGAAVSAT